MNFDIIASNNQAIAAYIFIILINIASIIGLYYIAYYEDKKHYEIYGKKTIINRVIYMSLITVFYSCGFYFMFLKS